MLNVYFTFNGVSYLLYLSLYVCLANPKQLVDLFSSTLVDSFARLV